MTTQSQRILRGVLKGESANDVTPDVHPSTQKDEEKDEPIFPTLLRKISITDLFESLAREPTKNWDTVDYLFSLAAREAALAEERRKAREAERERLTRDEIERVGDRDPWDRGSHDVHQRNAAGERMERMERAGKKYA